MQRALSPKGFPLLHICIRNETSSKNWPLREMLETMLEPDEEGRRNYAVQDHTFGDPLVVAVQNNCFESIKILNEKDPRFDFQMVDSSNVSMIGHLFIKLRDLDHQ